MTEHTDKHYEQELRDLKEAILTMGGMVEAMVSGSMRCLIERKPELGEAVIKQEPEVNQFEMAIDDRCLQMLALRQPTASDLRFITIGLKVSKDLERIGDLAVNITEQAVRINEQPQLKPYVDLPRMATKTEKMINEALNAFVNRDATRARAVCESDDEVDDLNARVFGELLELMKTDPAAVERGARLVLVARQLERIADHATNIAEEVIFMVQGKDIRHGQSSTT